MSWERQDELMKLSTEQLLGIYRERRINDTDWDGVITDDGIMHEALAMLVNLVVSQDETVKQI
jgi:hypothetical protein